jgi:hypothetical protein
MFDPTKLTLLQRRAVQQPFTNESMAHPAMTSFPGGYTLGLSLNA